MIAESKTWLPSRRFFSSKQINSKETSTTKHYCLVYIYSIMYTATTNQYRTKPLVDRQWSFQVVCPIWLDIQDSKLYHPVNILNIQKWWSKATTRNWPRGGEECHCCLTLRSPHKCHPPLFQTKRNGQVTENTLLIWSLSNHIDRIGWIDMANQITLPSQRDSSWAS
jgi:hypothetical protein